MKKLTILLLLVMVSAILLFTGCAKDDDDNGLTGIPDITPTNYDWDITLMSTDFKSTEYIVYADWLGSSSAITDTDVFTLDIDGQSHELMGGYDDGDWSFFSTAELNSGTLYNLVFKKNGSQVAAKNFRIPYQPTVTFPNTFDPTKTAKVTWQLQADNKYQAIVLFSEGDNDDDEYSKDISASARTFTFPANSVESYGPNTGYGMMLAEANFEKVGRVAFSSISYELQEYGNVITGKFEVSNLRKIAKNIRKQMQ